MMDDPLATPMSSSEPSPESYYKPYSWPAMLLIGLVMLCVIAAIGYVIYILTSKDKPSDDSSNTTHGNSTHSTLHTFTIKPNIGIVKGVKHVVILKNTENDLTLTQANARTIQIREVLLYDGNNQLLPTSSMLSAEFHHTDDGVNAKEHPAYHVFDNDMNTFASTSGGFTVHSILIRLKEPVDISMIQIVTNKDDLITGKHKLSNLQIIVSDSKANDLYAVDLGNVE